MKEKRIERQEHKCSGFTLIEVLLVVAILGMLAAVVVGNFGKQSAGARVKTTRASISSIETAVGVYQLDTGRYPSSLDNLISSSGAPNWNGPYIRGGKAALVDAWGTPFVFKASNDGDFKIISGGPDAQVGGSDDITSF